MKQWLPITGLAVAAVIAMAGFYFYPIAKKSPPTEWQRPVAPREELGPEQQGFQVGFVSPKPRAALSRAWDDSVNAAQVERAYCIHYTAVNDGGRIEYFVDGILEPETTEATPTAANIRCPLQSTAADRVGGALLQFGPNVSFGITVLHTHPPTTCDEFDKECAFGGKLAWACAPSRLDLKNSAQKNHAFEVLQCDRNAFVFFGFSQTLRVPQGIVEAGGI